MREQGRQWAEADEAELVAALRSGDESAFEYLVDAHSAWLLRLARQYVSTDAVAMEVVGDTWLAVVKGIDRFEGRSSLRTWIARILMNQARTRGVREARSVPFASAAPAGDGEPGGFDPDRFVSGLHRDTGRWSRPPTDWSTLPETRVESTETLDRVRAAIETLPERQREVITLRDVEGWTSAEVCDALGLSEGNQRVLLHRARSAVRRSLDEYLEAVR
jgi:RNA polymerase sigma-70 factor (ECF subfamily)